MLLAAIVGFAFGFFGSMPVAGPIAVLVFARGVENRLKSGLAIAAGGAVAEGIYAALAFWGFAELLERYPILVPATRAAAAIILTILGVIFIRGPGATANDDHPVARERWTGSFILGFFVTALNPTLIATWSAAAAALLSTGWINFDGGAALPFGLAATAGILAWFGLLLWLVRRFRSRFTPRTLDNVVRAMGLLLLFIAIWFAVLLLRSLL